MKKIDLVPFLIVILAICILISCKRDTSSKELISVSVKTPPTKLDYYLNETLDLDGVVITFTYDNGETKDVSFSDFSQEGITCTPEDGTLLSEEISGIIIKDINSEYETEQVINFNKLTDIDGNSYLLVKIGQQVWMAENLRTPRFNDGTQIPLVTDNTEWTNLTTAGYCWYNNDLENSTKFGAIYNAYAVETGKLAPSGWRVPYESDWNQLLEFISNNGFFENEAIALKSTVGWIDDGNGTDNFSFNVIPAGVRQGSGEFAHDGHISAWWSYEGDNALGDFLAVVIYSTSISPSTQSNLIKSVGTSIRLIKK